jgi:hypothetical protein
MGTQQGTEGKEVLVAATLCRRSGGSRRRYHARGERWRGLEHGWRPKHGRRREPRRQIHGRREATRVPWRGWQHHARLRSPRCPTTSCARLLDLVQGVVQVLHLLLVHRHHLLLLLLHLPLPNKLLVIRLEVLAVLPAFVDRGRWRGLNGPRERNETGRVMKRRFFTSNVLLPPRRRVVREVGIAVIAEEAGHRGSPYRYGENVECGMRKAGLWRSHSLRSLSQSVNTFEPF